LGQLCGEQLARPVALPLPAAPERLTFAGWPAGVELERQRWTMAFDSPGEGSKDVLLSPQAWRGIGRPSKPNGKPPRSRLELHPQEDAPPPPLPCPASGKDRLRALLEAALFAAPEPLRLSPLVRALGRSAEYREELLDEWAAEWAQEHHGLPLRLVPGGYQWITKPEHHAEMQQLFADLPEPAPLSRSSSPSPPLKSKPGAVSATATPSGPYLEETDRPRRPRPAAIRSATGQRKDLRGIWLEKPRRSPLCGSYPQSEPGDVKYSLSHGAVR
jgi:hypothetical protein